MASSSIANFIDKVRWSEYETKTLQLLYLEHGWNLEALMADPRAFMLARRSQTALRSRIKKMVTKSKHLDNKHVYSSIMNEYRALRSASPLSPRLQELYAQALFEYEDAKVRDAEGGGGGAGADYEAADDAGSESAASDAELDDAAAASSGAHTTPLAAANAASRKSFGVKRSRASMEAAAGEDSVSTLTASGAGAPNPAGSGGGGTPQAAMSTTVSVYDLTPRFGRSNVRKAAVANAEPSSTLAASSGNSTRHRSGTGAARTDAVSDGFTTHTAATAATAAAQPRVNSEALHQNWVTSGVIPLVETLTRHGMECAVVPTWFLREASEELNYYRNLHMLASTFAAHPPYRSARATRPVSGRAHDSNDAPCAATQITNVAAASRIAASESSTLGTTAAPATAATMAASGGGGGGGSVAAPTAAVTLDSPTSVSAAPSTSASTLTATTNLTANAPMPAPAASAIAQAPATAVAVLPLGCDTSMDPFSCPAAAVTSTTPSLHSSQQPGAQQLAASMVGVSTPSSSPQSCSLAAVPANGVHSLSPSPSGGGVYAAGMQIGSTHGQPQHVYIIGTPVSSPAGLQSHMFVDEAGRPLVNATAVMAAVAAGQPPQFFPPGTAFAQATSPQPAGSAPQAVQYYQVAAPAVSVVGDKPEVIAAAQPASQAPPSVQAVPAQQHFVAASMLAN